MRTTWSVAAVMTAALCVANLAGCSRAAAREVRLDAGRSLGTPITFRNLSLVPVYDTKATATGAYMTLDEGLKARRVTVRESPNGGDVNRLFVTNAGPKPVYLIAGEVVLGGQQDRCVGKDTVIPPSKRPIPITVFCVEHGRWSGEARFSDSARTVAAHKIRASAQEGAVAPVRGGDGPTAMAANARAARISEGQSKVWEEVAAKNRRFGAAPSSGTYRDVLQGTGGTSGASTAPYIKALASALPKDKRLAGVVVAVDGKVVAADVFGDTALFRKLFPKLLRSYASDAAEAAGGKAGRTKAVTASAARAFLAEAGKGKSSAVDRSADNTITRLETSKAMLFRSSSPAMGGAAAAKSLHENYLGK